MKPHESTNKNVARDQASVGVQAGPITGSVTVTMHGRSDLRGELARLQAGTNESARISQVDELLCWLGAGIRERFARGVLMPILQCRRSDISAQGLVRVFKQPSSKNLYGAIVVGAG
jgi:hypothetical protein